MNTRLSIARMLAATTVRPGLPAEGNGDDSVRVDQFHNAEGQEASRGNASHVRTSHTPARRQAYQRTYDKQTGSYQLGRWVSTDKR